MKKPARAFFFLLLAAAAAVAGFALRERLFPAPSLTLTSDPRAEVYVNGILRGLTPLTLKNLAPGDYALRLAREGCLPFRETLSIHGALERHVALAPRPAARIAIRSRPEGAAVYADGARRGRTPCTLEDLAPGTHFVELLKTNYLSAGRMIELRESATDEVETFVLEHRQEGAYRAILRKNPLDVAALNDLGELLYSLGRYPEAAEVFVSAYVAAAAKLRRTSAEEYSIKRLPRAARELHRDPEYLKAMDKAVLAAIGRGEWAELLVNDFRKIRWEKDPQAYRNALEQAFQHAGSAAQRIELARCFAESGALPRAAELLDRLFQEAAGDVELRLRILDEVNALLPRWQGPELSARQAAYLAAVESAVKGPVQTAELLYEKALWAHASGRTEEGMAFLREAVEKQPDAEKTNRYRLKLAERCFAAQAYPETAELLRKILDTGRLREETYREARSLLRKVPEEFQEPAKPDRTDAPSGTPAP
ncbi:MAG: PEGA domain-containing protein [Planctomycetota bacterium]